MQQQAVSVAEDEPHVAMTPKEQLRYQEWQRKQLWAYLYEICGNEANANTTTASPNKLIEAKIWASVGIEKPPGPDLNGAVYAKPYEPRSFEACVFCAMLHWSEHLKSVYIAGENNEIKNPAAVADLLSVDWYSDQWPLIPKEELNASAIDFPYEENGERLTKKILMHKRRVTKDHLSGIARAKVCEDCYDAFCKKTKPTLSKWCLSNYHWLGRHLPIFRDATLAHQLLLALGRVVSTKVYLSSKGVDVVTRQHHQSWRKKFLQQGMSGTAIVYGNGSADDAMASFPPGQRFFFFLRKALRPSLPSSPPKLTP